MSTIDLRDVQGNLLRSYGRTYGFVRHLVLAVGDPALARAALRGMVTGDRATPEVTTAERSPRQEGMAWCLNVGVTYRGLAALGVPPDSLRTFPIEFRQGMVARAASLGDVGGSAPEHWIGGLGKPAQVHLVVTIHGQRREDIGPVSDAVIGSGSGRAFTQVSPVPFDGAMFTGPHEGGVHFGYQDGLSNLRFEGIHEADDPPIRGTLAPIGAVLLGHPSTLQNVTWRIPSPRPLGFNGAFNAFRVLNQDIHGFETFLRRAAKQTGCTVGEVAAKICGRWRNGAPLTEAPTEAESKKFTGKPTNAFDYRDDQDGARCPVGSHIRRSNPRNAHIVQRGTNDTRVIVRRGMPYGKPYDAEHDHAEDEPRGLLGNFICASLAAQFEAMQCDWLNMGLQDPRITGTNDPLVGANDPATGRFEWRTSGGDDVVVGGLDRFVQTVGGAYCFLPSLPAIRWIASC